MFGAFPIGTAAPVPANTSIPVVTTTGATPTVTMSPTDPYTYVVLGNDVTSLTIDGLDLNAAGAYGLIGAVIGAGAEVDIRLNGNNTAGDHKFAGVQYLLGGTITSFELARFVFTNPDANDASNASFSVCGQTGYAKTVEGAARYTNATNKYFFQSIGRFAPTANVTSIVVSGTMKAGSQLLFIRGRSTT